MSFMALQVPRAGGKRCRLSAVSRAAPVSSAVSGAFSSGGIAVRPPDAASRPERPAWSAEAPAGSWAPLCRLAWGLCASQGAVFSAGVLQAGPAVSGVPCVPALPRVFLCVALTLSPGRGSSTGALCCPPAMVRLLLRSPLAQGACVEAAGDPGLSWWGRDGFPHAWLDVACGDRH